MCEDRTAWTSNQQLLPPPDFSPMFAGKECKLVSIEVWKRRFAFLKLSEVCPQYSNQAGRSKSCGGPNLSEKLRGLQEEVLTFLIEHPSRIMFRRLGGEFVARGKFISQRDEVFGATEFKVFQGFLCFVQSC